MGLNFRTGLRHVRYASTAMRMPAMSPTMTEGGITGWKKQEGESFAAGDVLLEVVSDLWPVLSLVPDRLSLSRRTTALIGKG